MPTGSPLTKLIIIRGNSGAGKSSIARRLQRLHGRGCALVEQDYLRRIVLRERDEPGGIVPGLIDHTVRFALDHGYHVILEGILVAAKYGGTLTGLLADHAGDSHVFYLDVTLEETLRRHQSRPQAGEFTAEEMRAWYRERDVLGIPGEHVLPETVGLERAVAIVAATARLPLEGRDEDFVPPARGPGTPLPV